MIHTLFAWWNGFYLFQHLAFSLSTWRLEMHGFWCMMGIDIIRITDIMEMCIGYVKAINVSDVLLVQLPPKMIWWKPQKEYTLIRLHFKLNTEPVLNISAVFILSFMFTLFTSEFPVADFYQLKTNSIQQGYFYLCEMIEYDYICYLLLLTKSSSWQLPISLTRNMTS